MQKITKGRPLFIKQKYKGIWYSLAGKLPGKLSMPALAPASKIWCQYNGRRTTSPTNQLLSSFEILVTTTKMHYSDGDLFFCSS
jgi:hypothetical protein